MTLRPRLGRRTLSLLVVFCCLLGGLVVARGSDPAAARPDFLRQGLGRHAGHDFVGFYVTRDGTKVWCLDPRRATPSRVALHTVSRYPGSSRATSDALAYALTRWGKARSRDAAAVQSQVLNTLAGNRRDVARRARALPVKLRRLTTAHVEQARALRGPYRVTVSLPVPALPGHSAVGTVRVVSAGRHAVRGVAVRLRGTANVALPHAVRTGRTGTARFGYRAVEVGATRVRAVVTGAPGTGIRINTPRRGEQRLATAAPTGAVAASAGYRAVPGGFGHRYACASDCAGRPRVTLTACAPVGAVASRIVYRVGGRGIVRAFSAGTRKRCMSTVVTLADRSRVTASWQYRVGRGWTRPLAAAGTFTVDCPRAPALTVTVGHDCARATVTVRARPSAHPTQVRIGGGRRAVVTAAPGRSAAWTVSAPCGVRLPVTARGAVLRAGGGWNTGPAISVVTP